MRRLKTIGVTLTVLTGLLAGSGIAVADSHESGDETNSVADTLLNFGYDMINRIFLWNTSALDGAYDCTLENGTLTVTYGETAEDGSIAVDNLQDDQGAVVEFPNRDPEDVGEEVTPATEPVEYSGSDGECGLTGGEVTGPQGQVNHGMFLKLFNELYDGAKRGCVVRFIAQSDLGKGDQQVQAGDDTEFTSVEPGGTGTVDFTSVEADCEKGPHGQGAEAAGKGKGKPEGVGNGKPPWAGGPGGPHSDD